MIQCREEIVENAKHIEESLVAVRAARLHRGKDGRTLREHLINDRVELDIAKQNTVMRRARENLKSSLNAVNVLNALLLGKHALDPLFVTQTSREHICETSDKSERMAH